MGQFNLYDRQFVKYMHGIGSKSHIELPKAN